MTSQGPDAMNVLNDLSDMTALGGVRPATRQEPCERRAWTLAKASRIPMRASPLSQVGSSSKRVSADPRPEGERSARRRSGRPSTRLGSSFRELELPEEPLLEARDEVELGSRVQVSLGRLHALIARHPTSLERWVGRMERSTRNEERVFPWQEAKLPVERDLACARKALARFSALRARRPREAAQALVELGELLDGYPLEPEVTLRWAEVALSSQSEPRGLIGRRLARIEALAKRLLARVLEARDRLTVANARLVLRETLSFRPAGSVTRSDLFQDGYLGIQKAALRFDPNRQLRFSTYAVYWIRQSIRYAFVHTSRMVRVPERAQDQVRRWLRGEEDAIDGNEAERIVRIMNQTASLSAGGDDDEGGFGDTVQATFSAAPQRIESLYEQELPSAVEKAIGELSDRERHVLTHRFGLEGRPRMTLEKLGAALQLSRERVRQIEVEALKRLRDHPLLEELHGELVQAFAGAK